MKDRNIKWVLSGSKYQWEGGGNKSEGGQIWWIHFVFICGNRPIKSIETAL
jgi:hypothetical protein